jgi:hypothetical protein
VGQPDSLTEAHYNLTPLESELCARPSTNRSESGTGGADIWRRYIQLGPLPCDCPENTIRTVWQYPARRNRVRFAGGFTRRNIVTKTRADRFGIALEAALSRLELESALSGLLCGAMERIVDGTYGRCLGCSVTIAPERLRALPWVRLCAGCQDAADQRNELDRSSAPGHTPDESDREPSVISRNLPDGRGHSIGYLFGPSRVCIDPAVFIGMFDMRPTRRKR